MSTAVKFRQQNLPRQPTERARLKVVQGPDYGSVYVISGGRASIGRGDDCDVMISDLKASRRHAEIEISPSGWIVRDLGSANGIIYNGKLVHLANLKSHDTLSLGETILEFFPAESGTAVLLAPPKLGAQLVTENAEFEAQRLRVKALGRSRSAKAPQGGPTPRAQSKGPSMLLIVVGGIGAFLLLWQPSTPTPKKSAKSESQRGSTETRNIASIIPLIQDSKEINQAAEQFFKMGFREYRERNYLRAKANFDNVLQIDPGHAMAHLYVDHCIQSIAEEVTQHLEQGKKSLDTGKLRSAKSHFESAMRLLSADPVNPRYLEARDNLEKVEKQLKGGQS